RAHRARRSSNGVFAAVPQQLPRFPLSLCRAGRPPRGGGFLSDGGGSPRQGSGTGTARTRCGARFHSRSAYPERHQPTSRQMAEGESAAPSPREIPRRGGEVNGNRRRRHPIWSWVIHTPWVLAVLSLLGVMIFFGSGAGNPLLQRLIVSRLERASGGKVAMERQALPNEHSQASLG